MATVNAYRCVFSLALNKFVSIRSGKSFGWLFQAVISELKKQFTDF